MINNSVIYNKNNNDEIIEFPFRSNQKYCQIRIEFKSEVCIGSIVVKNISSEFITITSKDYCIVPLTQIKHEYEKRIRPIRSFHNLSCTTSSIIITIESKHEEFDVSLDWVKIFKNRRTPNKKLYPKRYPLNIWFKNLI